VLGGDRRGKLSAGRYRRIFAVEKRRKEEDKILVRWGPLEDTRRVEDPEAPCARSLHKHFPSVYVGSHVW
jgi:hypothetical protein